MGSCISPIIASLYMEHVEHTAITTFYTPPTLWLRYVDDTFCILNKDHINDFHSHLTATQYARIFSSPLKKNTIFLFHFLTFWLNAKVAMVTPPLTVFYLPQFTKNPLTPTDIFTIRHIISNVKSSLLPKLYSAG